MNYSHRFQDGRTYGQSLGKIVCVGRNYAEHAKELNNPIPESPLLFIKPESAAAAFEGEIQIPLDKGEVHYELELALLIGKPLRYATSDEVSGAIAGYGLALDLTLRDLQSELKAKGQPWERAKCFDGACPISKFITSAELPDPQSARISLTIDGVVRQDGSAADMLNPILPLIAYMSTQFTLKVGDVILTGTPKGVGPLQVGQQLTARLNDRLETSAIVVPQKRKANGQKAEQK
jgi:2-keto-4-pentenoate hydratase/2-oxohepta-3-ene-1,7-dioic acid hydratase in catechol pathway